MTPLEISVKGYHRPSRGRGHEAEQCLKNALLNLLVKGEDYGTITNQDILKEANRGREKKTTIHNQSMYKWFLEGKDTIVRVLTAEFDQRWANEIKSFVGDPEHLNRNASEIVKEFNKRSIKYFHANKEAAIVWFNETIPGNLREPSPEIQSFLLEAFIELLQRLGVNDRRELIATTIITLTFALRELSIKPVSTKDGKVRIIVGKGIEEELEKVLVEYLKLYIK